MMNFFKLFPLPAYLRIPAVGIDISDRSIKYVELKKHGDSLRLKNFGEKKIDPGIIEAGMIKKKDELISVLRALRNEIGNPYIVSALPEERAFLKVVHLPLTEENKIRKALELQLEEIVPLSPKDVEFDYEFLGKGTENNLVIVLTAFPKKISGDYLDVFDASKFFPLALEVENQAIARTLVPVGQKRAVLIVDFGKTRTSFLISHDGVVKFTSTISVAGESLNKALANNFKIGVFEAEQLKQKYMIGGEEDEKIQSAIKPIMQAIKEETQRLLAYWDNYVDGRIKEGGDRNIAEIVLCGGESNLSGFPEYLAFELKKPVKLGRAWQNITDFRDYVPEMDYRESLAYVTAIGLALRSF